MNFYLLIIVKSTPTLLIIAVVFLFLVFQFRFSNFLLQAAILQQAAEYLYQLEQERTQLLSQNCHLKRIISQHEGELALSSPPSPSAPSKKRKLIDTSGEDAKSNVFVFIKIHTYIQAVVLGEI